MSPRREDELEAHNRLDIVRTFGAAEEWLAVVACAREDGSVHASLVNAGVLDDPVTGQPVIGFVMRGCAESLLHVRRGGRATVVYRSGWNWASVEGPARIVGPDDPSASYSQQSVLQLLRDVFVAAGRTYHDWTWYDKVMMAERRAAVLVDPVRITSNLDPSDE